MIQRASLSRHMSPCRPTQESTYRRLTDTEFPSEVHLLHATLGISQPHIAHDVYRQFCSMVPYAQHGCSISYLILELLRTRSPGQVLAVITAPVMTWAVRRSFARGLRPMPSHACEVMHAQCSAVDFNVAIATGTNPERPYLAAGLIDVDSVVKKSHSVARQSQWTTNQRITVAKQAHVVNLTQPSRQSSQGQVVRVRDRADKLSHVAPSQRQRSDGRQGHPTSVYQSGMPCFG